MRADAGGGCDASFFDATNKEASKQRENAAASALADMLGWLDAPFEGMAANNSANASSASLVSQAIGALSGGSAITKKKMRKDRVAIFDTTNASRPAPCSWNRSVTMPTFCENFLTKVHNSRRDHTADC